MLPCIHAHLLAGIMALVRKNSTTYVGSLLAKHGFGCGMHSVSPSRLQGQVTGLSMPFSKMYRCPMGKASLLARYTTSLASARRTSSWIALQASSWQFGAACGPWQGRRLRPFLMNLLVAHVFLHRIGCVFKYLGIHGVFLM